MELKGKEMHCAFTGKYCSWIKDPET